MGDDDETYCCFGQGSGSLMFQLLGDVIELINLGMHDSIRIREVFFPTRLENIQDDLVLKLVSKGTSEKLYF